MSGNSVPNNAGQGEPNPNAKQWETVVTGDQQWEQVFQPNTEEDSTDQPTPQPANPDTGKDATDQPTPQPGNPDVKSDDDIFKPEAFEDTVYSQKNAAMDEQSDIFRTEQRRAWHEERMNAKREYKEAKANGQDVGEYKPVAYSDSEYGKEAAARRKLVKEFSKENYQAYLGDTERAQQEDARKKHEAEKRQSTEEEVKRRLEEAAKKRLEEEEKRKLEEEQKKKEEEEAKKKLEEEEKNKGKGGPNQPQPNPGKKDDEPLPPTPQAPIKPLVAINADFSIDRKNLARQEAETLLNQEVSTSKGLGGIIKRIWKGSIAKKYYQKKYERELLKDGDDALKTVEGRTINEMIEERKNGALKRFELAITEDMGYIHREIGKVSKDGKTYEDGEDITDADEKMQKFVKEVITDFVKAEQKHKNVSSDELKKRFIERFNYKKKQAEDKGESFDLDITNYGEVALQALELTMHGEAIENVMKGFRVVNAKVNDEIRTEAHRDAVDKIVDAYERKTANSKIQFIPPEVIALAAGTAISLAQMGARSAASAVAPAVGGILVSSAISGIRERNRIAEDRAHMMRDIANGLTYDSKDGKKSRKQERYEKNIGGTLYNTAKASELTEGIENALKMEGSSEERGEAILRALAEARVRRDFSDSEQKDLISYSSAGKRGEERLALDMALIRAEKELPYVLKEKYAAMKDLVKSEIENGYNDDEGNHVAGVNEQDKTFNRKRALMAAAKAGKTALIGAAFFFGSQELMAAISPTKIGIFEKWGLLKTTNDDNAKETLIASGFGTKRGTFTRLVSQNTVKVNGDDTHKMQELSQQGYRGQMVSPGSTTTTVDLVEVDPSSSDLSTNIVVDGWINNNTDVADINEVRMYIRDGYLVSGMRGNATMGNQVFNIEALKQSGQLKAFATIGGKRFELVQTANDQWGSGSGMFDVISPDGSVGTVQLIGENGQKLYEKMEFAVDKGFDGNGIKHILPLATDPHGGSFDGLITQQVERTVEIPPVFEYTKDIFRTFTRGVTGAGIAFAPETGRRGLGVATAAPNNVEPPVTTPPEQPVDNGGAAQPPDGGNVQPPDRGAAQPPDRSNVQPPDGGNVQPPDGGNVQPPVGGNDGNNQPPVGDTSGQGNSANQEPVSEIERQREVDIEKYRTLIQRLGGLIGETGQKILLNTGREDEPTITAAEYSNWWNSLSDDTKNKVRQVVTDGRKKMSDRWAARGDNTPVRFAQGFAVWLELNDNAIPNQAPAPAA